MGKEFVPNTYVAERLALIVDLQKHAEQDIHKIMNILCVIRDMLDDPKYQEEVDANERMLHAFLTRKRLGMPVTFNALEREFLGKWLNK